MHKKVHGVNLKEFFEKWVFSSGYIEVEIDYSYNKKTNELDMKVL